MITLRSISNGGAPGGPPARPIQPGEATAAHAGTRPAELSRSTRARLALGTGTPGGPPRTAVKSVLGQDDRVRITETALPPWRIICALRLVGAPGMETAGTGCFVGPRTILTAGHCVYSTRLLGGWATSAEASPGQNAAERPFRTVTGTRFSTLDRWYEGQDPDFDVGCIHLPAPAAGEESPGTQVGWFGVGALPDGGLEDHLVNIAGYPDDRGGATELYHHRNKIVRVEERRVYHDVDTYAGQSGAPVWIQDGPEAPPLVVAVHAYGVDASSPRANSASRVIPEVLDRIKGWVEEDGGWQVT